jgi:membrane protease YdiL (CAAX protease family)
VRSIQTCEECSAAHTSVPSPRPTAFKASYACWMTSTLIGVAIAYVAILSAVDIVWTPRYLASIKTRIAADDATARRSMYHAFIAFDWIAAALALAILFAAGLPAKTIGLVSPSGDWLDEHASVLGGLAIGLVAGGIVMVVRERRGEATPIVGDIDVLIPRTTMERRWFAALAVTAGLAEEVIYRALPIIVLVAVLPATASPWWAVAIAAAVFGAAHFYQGLSGVIATAAMGVVFGAMLIVSHSLIPGMILHALVDLRLLVLRPVR